MAKELEQFTAPVRMTGTLYFKAESVSEATEWLTTNENKVVGMALVNLDDDICKVKNIKVEFIEEGA